MRVAVIDLGTNTFNLLIADFSQKNYTVTENLKLPVNLGKDGINNGFITDEAIERGLKALHVYQKRIKESGAEKTFAFATSAIRNAANGLDFVTEIKKQTGFDIEVISGDREAELIYHGVELSGSLEENPGLIMDIGGGSTEFIICTDKDIFWKKSFELGAARLLEKFNISDPITQHEIFEMEDYLSSCLGDLDQAMQEHPAKLLIGSSGSFDTLAEMIAHRFYTPDIIEHKSTWEFNLDDYYSIHEHIIRSTKIERLRTKGMMEMRVDMIVVATLFVYFIIRRYHLQRMKLSTYALKEGVLNKILHGELI